MRPMNKGGRATREEAIEVELVVAGDRRERIIGWKYEPDPFQDFNRTDGGSVSFDIIHCLALNFSLKSIDQDEARERGPGRVPGWQPSHQLTVWMM